MSAGSQIHAVGHHLQLEANKPLTPERDAFARSAFNRYYYSAFLNIRELLSALDASWSSLPHKSYPDLLKGQVKRRLNEARRRAGRIGDTPLINRIDNAKRAIDELSKVMSTAYGIRVVADYEPGEAVNFETTSRFALRSVDISDAHEWENSTRVLCQNVRKTWDEING